MSTANTPVARAWFRNARIYRLTKPFNWDPEILGEALGRRPFNPCGAQDVERLGWTQPTGGDTGPMVFSSGNCHLICLKRESRVLPPAVVREEADKRIGAAEAEQGRPLRRKERNEIKEQVELELIPKAFTRSHHTSAYIDLDQQIVVVDAASSGEAETLLSELRETLGSLPVRPPAMNQSPAFTMTQWVAGQAHMPQYLAHDSECELRDTGETPVAVKVKGLDLGAEEITSHIDNGMMVQKLALNWGESLSFILDDELTLRRIHFTHQMKEALDDQGGDDAIERFDSAFALMTLEISRLLPTLLEGFGGEDTSAMAA